MLQETLSETKNAALSKHVNVLHDQNIINSGSLESIKAQADAFEKVSNRRIWPDSSFMPIVLRGAILGYVEFPASKAFKLFPEELPNAVSEILKSTELYLSHVSTYLANIQLQESSYKDQLTGVYNRRGFYEKAIELFLEQPECTGGLIAFDLDHFKRVNDRL